MDNLFISSQIKIDTSANQSRETSEKDYPIIVKLKNKLKIRHT